MQKKVSNHNVLQSLLTMLYIGRAHYDVGHIALSKGIHILNAYLCSGQTIQDLSQSASLVGTMQMYNVSEHHGKVGIAQYLCSLVHV